MNAMASRLHDLNSCAFCLKTANYSCERCDEPYCSLQCQEDDFRKHRYVCIPKPRLLPRTRNSSPSSTSAMGLREKIGYDAPDAVAVNNDDTASTRSTAAVTHLARKLETVQIDDLKEIHQKMVEETTPPPRAMSPAKKTVPSAPIKSVKAPQETTPNHQNGTLAAGDVATPKTTEQNVRPQLGRMAKLLKPGVAAVKVEPVCKPKAVAIKNAEIVNIVHVEDHRTICINPCAKSKELCDLIEAVNDHAKSAPQYEQPEAGKIVLAPSTKKTSYGRAVIQSVQGDLVNVEFLDFGTTETVSDAKLKTLSIELANRPRTVNKLTLSDVPSVVRNPEKAIGYLENFMKKEISMIATQLKTVEQSDISVHLSGNISDSVNCSSVNEQINDWHTRLTPEPEEEQVHISYTTVSGNNIKMLILDNSLLNLGYVSAIQSKDQSTFAQYDTRINDNAAQLEMQKPFAPRDEEMCIVKSSTDDRWYRASALQKKDDNTYMIMYLDYGNIENDIPISRIRELSNEFAFPCLTVSCYIEGVGFNGMDELDGSLVSAIKPILTPMDEYTFDRIVYNDEGAQAFCSSSSLIDALKRQKLI